MFHNVWTLNFSFQSHMKTCKDYSIIRKHHNINRPGNGFIHYSHRVLYLEFGIEIMNIFGSRIPNPKFEIFEDTLVPRKNYYGAFTGPFNNNSFAVIQMG